MDWLRYLDVVQGTIISLLVLLQALISFVLPPEKAEKYNYIGKALDYLVNTKKGLSFRKDK